MKENPPPPTAVPCTVQSLLVLKFTGSAPIFWGSRKQAYGSHFCLTIFHVSEVSLLSSLGLLFLWAQHTQIASFLGCSYRGLRSCKRQLKTASSAPLLFIYRESLASRLFGWFPLDQHHPERILRWPLGKEWRPQRNIPDIQSDSSQSRKPPSTLK